MIRSGVRVTAILALGLCAMLPAFGNPTYDAVTDFSLSANPNGTWTYGWLPAGSTDTSTINLNAFPETGLLEPGEIAWSKNSTTDLPEVGRNTTVDDIAFSGPLSGIVQPAYLLLLHAGSTGDWSILRWTAPADGIYDVDGYFQNIDTNGTLADINFAIDGVLFNSLASLDGFGDTRPIIGTQFFAQGQTVDFIVQTGSAGMAMSFNSVPEPVSLILAGIGLLGLGILRRRR